jgi:hypothetical membrane protein
MKRGRKKKHTNPRLDKLLLLAGIVGPIIFFVNLTIFGFFIEGYNPLYHYISKLGAVDSPIKTVTNVFVFSLFGIFIMLFSIAIYRSKELRWGKFISLFFFLTGFSIYLVGIFACDPGCENFTVQGILHEKTSNWPFTIFGIGIFLLVLDLSNHKRLQWLTLIIIPIGTITLVLTYFSIISPSNVQYPGLLQRVVIGLPHVIIIIIAMGLYRVQKK